MVHRDKFISFYLCTGLRMYWLTENAFQPAMIGLLVVFGTGAFWFVLKKKPLLIAAIVALVCTIGIVVVEQLIVTDSEQIKNDLVLIAGAVQSNDLDTVLGYISPEAENMIAEAKREMSDVDFKKLSVKRFSDPEIDLEATPPTASISFNAIISASTSPSSRYGNIPRINGAVRVTVFYEKDSAGKWKIVDYNYQRITTNDLMGTK